MDSAWEQKKPEARKLLAVGAADHLSGAPWNDSRQSFSTGERPVVYTKKTQKVAIFVSSQKTGERVKEGGDFAKEGETFKLAPRCLKTLT
jgi:hypothetical protein